MKKDIKIPIVENVTLAVKRSKNDEGKEEWSVHIINLNDVELENVLVTSKGYGEQNGEKQKTSTLRHYFKSMPAQSTALIEPIDPSVFHLNNEYWVSYYIDKQIFDKKFIFVPDTIKEENLSFIKELEGEGILHS